MKFLVLLSILCMPCTLLSQSKEVKNDYDRIQAMLIDTDSLVLKLHSVTINVWPQDFSGHFTKDGQASYRFNIMLLRFPKDFNGFSYTSLYVFDKNKKKINYPDVLYGTFTHKQGEDYYNVILDDKPNVEELEIYITDGMHGGDAYRVMIE